jgi:hypothetical protein
MAKAARKTIRKVVFMSLSFDGNFPSWVADVLSVFIEKRISSGDDIEPLTRSLSLRKAQSWADFPRYGRIRSEES